MIQNSRHTDKTPNGSPAQPEMRCGRNLSACLRAGFDNPNYQGKLGGLDSTEKKI